MPGRFGRHGKCRNPSGARPASACHHHQQIGGTGAGDKRFAAIQYVFIAIAPRGGFQAGGVRAGIRLGQAIRRQFLPLGQCRAPFSHDFRLAPSGHHPGRHVVDGEIGGGRGAAGGQLFEHDAGVEAAQAQPASTLRRIQAAEAQLAGLGDFVLGEDVLLVPLCCMRRQFVCGEVARRLLEGALVVVEFKIHDQRSEMVVLTPPVFTAHRRTSARSRFWSGYKTAPPVCHRGRGHRVWNRASR
jgi:hypothetical protein